MAGAASISVSCNVTGLGTSRAKSKSFSGEIPTSVTSQYRVQDTADTVEALALGDVSTVYGIAIEAVDNNMYVDTTYGAAFSPELVIIEGEAQYFRPGGTVAIKNETGAEVCTYDYTVFGVV